VGIEHHPHLHAALVSPQQGLLDGGRLQLELLKAQGVGGAIDQGHHGLGSVIGHDQQPLVGGLFTRRGRHRREVHRQSHPCRGTGWSRCKPWAEGGNASENTYKPGFWP
jgi:hypothetical protein